MDGPLLPPGLLLANILDGFGTMTLPLNPPMADVFNLGAADFLDLDLLLLVELIFGGLCIVLLALLLLVLVELDAIAACLVAFLPDEDDDAGNQSNTDLGG